MSEYKTFMPTEKMLEELKCRLIYRDSNDLEKDLHKQKMLIMFMNHKMIPADRTEFHKFYNEYYFELGYYARLIFNREELWFKGQVEHFLKTKEPSYGVDLPENEFMNNGFDEKVTNATLSLLKNYLGDNWVENSRGVKISDNIYLEWGKRFEWPDINENIKGEKFFCYGLKDQFGILVDGTVVPCCLDCDGVINLGNIYKEDIESILNSKRAKDIVNGFRLGVASEELCKKCGYAQRFIK